MEELSWMLCKYSKKRKNKKRNERKGKDKMQLRPVLVIKLLWGRGLRLFEKLITYHHYNKDAQIKPLSLPLGTRCMSIEMLTSLLNSHIKPPKKLMMSVFSIVHLQHSSLIAKISSVKQTKMQKEKKSLTKYSVKLITLPSPKFQAGMIYIDKCVMSFQIIATWILSLWFHRLTLARWFIKWEQFP